MKNTLKIMTVFFIILLIGIILIIAGLVIKNESKNDEENVSIIDNVSKETKKSEEKNETFVIGIDKKNTSLEEEKKDDEKEPEQEKKAENIDASTWTQNIYNLNMEIGTLYIPKIGLTTSVYSNSNVNMMEKMPCFLYTTGGLNKKGITLFVGHNRRNGKIFSENKKLEVGDIFLFKDYEGIEKEYTIYDKFITDSGDISFLNNQVDFPVIALSCCTDASDENRIIILGKAN